MLAAIQVVGDVSSGKTCFVNALVEALALLSEPASTSALPAQWQVPEEAIALHSKTAREGITISARLLKILTNYPPGN